MQPLQGLRVFEIGDGVASGIAALILADAGAEVTKIVPSKAADTDLQPVDQALRSRGKRTMVADLNVDGARTIQNTLRDADILIEETRPGTLGELGLGYEDLKAGNPRLIYCSISGYGQTGPMANEVSQDLNRLGATGLLHMGAGAAGGPVVPGGRTGDIAAGAFPCVMNILLALRARESTDEGCYLDLAIADTLFTFAYERIGAADMARTGSASQKAAPVGASPRYQLYATADDRFVAVAAVEDRHWDNLCERLELEDALRDDRRAPQDTERALAAIIGARSAAFWRDKFENRDLCCSVADTLEEALANPQFRARGLFDRTVAVGGGDVTAVVTPVAPQFRTESSDGPGRAKDETGKILETQ